MGVGSILRFFLPQDDKFLPFFEQSAEQADHQLVQRAPSLRQKGIGHRER